MFSLASYSPVSFLCSSSFFFSLNNSDLVTFNRCSFRTQCRSKILEMKKRTFAVYLGLNGPQSPYSEFIQPENSESIRIWAPKRDDSMPSSCPTEQSQPEWNRPNKKEMRKVGLKLVFIWKRYAFFICLVRQRKSSKEEHFQVFTKQ